MTDTNIELARKELMTLLSKWSGRAVLDLELNDEGDHITISVHVMRGHGQV